MSDPVFIHSLFRAGSTYIFNCFRRSPAGYWCYQEPLNEFILNAATRAEALLELHTENAKHLRHPEIDRPYFFEFFPMAARIGETLRSTFSYEDYFSTKLTDSESLCQYLTALVDGAKGRPMFQECRSSGRVAGIRECIGGVHIYLWRNPWDQWWSYKVDSHFEICNLQILASRHAPASFVELRNLLGFDPDGSDVRSLKGRRLDAEGSYMLFFALWCHAMLEALPRCDLDINIDSLSSDENYRAMLVSGLEAKGVTGLDFSDCTAPRGIYGKDDRAFFDDLEMRVFDLFMRHGYAASDIERVRSLRDEHDCHASLIVHSAAAAKEFDRLRGVARRLESELSGVQREENHLAGALEKKSSECESLAAALDASETEKRLLKKAFDAKEEEYRVLSTILNAREINWRSLEDWLDAKDAECRSLKMLLDSSEATRRSLELDVNAKEEERLSLAAALGAAEAGRQSLEGLLEANEAVRKSLELALEAKEAQRQSLATALTASELALDQIRTSRYWRWGTPIRALVGSVRKVLQYNDRGGE